MKQGQMLILGVLMGTTLMPGCATGPFNSSDAGLSSQQEAARAVLDYRKLAAELREMAHRREIEAEILSKQPNPDQARITHWRDMAKQLVKEADVAEQHAREMQKTVPHGMIQ